MYMFFFAIALFLILNEIISSISTKPPPKATIFLRVLNAKNLPAKDSNGYSDPYLKIYSSDSKNKCQISKVHIETLNPIFDEVFLLKFKENEKLVIEVHDSDTHENSKKVSFYSVQKFWIIITVYLYDYYS